ncbi:M20/M25/M40 family metallo-hydrolase [Terriglobus albidus]|uniref:M20/M25/M40 family metallo-hydrolase n=1 Tax=Terriglobus albidus TaxID=1592106 RepID=UPI0021E04389|nr:M20/M25/M40 family metallo-hydrolase [Terriglobus albidus]
MTPDAQKIRTLVENNRELLLKTLEDLIRIPSENRSPAGDEAACQQYLAERLKATGYEYDLYPLNDVRELRGHPLSTPDRDYPDRPNLSTVRRGSGGGRSLILSGHIDTVPRGTLPWTRDAFEAVREGDRIYGRGANDMKAGVAINLFVLQMLDAMRLRLRGDVIFESVVDEEFGGVNGTLAARLRGSMADAAIVTEPSSLRICAAQRGGRTVHLLFTASGGVLDGGPGAGVITQLKRFMDELPNFANQRKRECKGHALYQSDDPVPVTITKITTGPWGTSEPITVPEECRVELYWQLMPGEEQADVDTEFQAWLDGLINAAPDIFASAPTLTKAVRWLPGSAIEADEPLCVELADAAQEANGTRPSVVGMEAPCDMFIFHRFGIPAVLWGPSGAGAHGSDEYVTISSMLDAAAALLLFTCRWCGVAGGPQE